MPPRTSGCFAGWDLLVAMGSSPRSKKAECQEAHSARTREPGRARQRRSDILWRLGRPARQTSIFLRCGRAQAIELLADMRGLGRSVGKRNGPVEGNAGFLGAVELQQEGAAGAVEVKIAVEFAGQRLDHRQRR